MGYRRRGEGGAKLNKKRYVVYERSLTVMLYPYRHYCILHKSLLLSVAIDTKVRLIL